MKVAYVHDWLVTWRGGEKVLDALLTLYPEAPVYTLFHNPDQMPERINCRDIRKPCGSRILRPVRKAALPILPGMIESLDLSAYDLIISTSSCVAKGVKKRPGARHLCYLHSPMRYIWDQQREYLEGVRHIPLARTLIRAATPRLRQWDIRTAARVDRFVANSSFVAERALKYYGRTAAVIHPPIELDRFRPGPPPGRREGYLLAAGAFVSYKRYDLAIAAAEKLGRRLIIAGFGPLENQLRSQAGPHTEILVNPDDETFARLLAGADAFLFPGVEDFGMVAVEAMASGTPVIAYAAGGARDFIIPGETGVFFEDQTPEGLTAAIRGFEPARFDPAALARHATRYSRENFLTRIRAELAQLMGTAGIEA